MTDFVVHFAITLGVFVVSNEGRRPDFGGFCASVICALCVASLIHIGFGERARRDEIDGFFGG